MNSKQIWKGIAAVLAVTVMSGVLVPLFEGGTHQTLTNRELIVPNGSPVRFSYEGEYDGGSARIFLGDLVISGTYFYGYEYEGGGEPTLFMVPDEASAAVLPHWKRWGVVKRIDLINPAAFAKSVLPHDVIEKITKKQLATTRGHITIVAYDFEAAGECDQPVYLAKFKSVYRPKDMMATRPNTVTNCG